MRLSASPVTEPTCDREGRGVVPPTIVGGGDAAFLRPSEQRSGNLNIHPFSLISGRGQRNSELFDPTIRMERAECDAT
jgi:hypothetical protein